MQTVNCFLSLLSQNLELSRQSWCVWVKKYDNKQYKEAEFILISHCVWSSLFCIGKMYLAHSGECCHEEVFLCSLIFRADSSSWSIWKAQYNTAKPVTNVGCKMNWSYGRVSSQSFTPSTLELEGNSLHVYMMWKSRGLLFIAWHDTQS